MQSIFKKTIIVIVIFLSSYLVALAALPNVYIVATGGTIAGVAKSSTAAVYKAGSLSINDILEKEPAFGKLANIKSEQFYNIDSVDMTMAMRIKLAEYVQKLIDDPNVNAVIITHGTDSMVQTAFFLNQVLDVKKPVILVGAMRAFTSLSSDALMNLYDALVTAVNKQSIGKGVLVVMNEEILTANDVAKTNTTNVDAFKAPNYGKLGTVIIDDVDYYQSPRVVGNILSVDDLQKITALPKVEVIYESADISPEFLDSVLTIKGLEGIVLAGLGDGNIPSNQGDFLKKARAKGIVVVRSSYVGSGKVTHNYNNLDDKFDLVSSATLSPEKARIFLQLCLIKTHDIKKIQKLFDRF
ncbi:asparaginase [Francisella tularensis]|uniref:asparaginase n=1 Tax=Francisella tularensis TaxID=263 RepID=UPI0005B62BAB|nr:asparaginase [Francisella tularensis]